MMSRRIPCLIVLALLVGFQLLAPKSFAVVTLVSVDITSTEPDPTPATTIPLTFTFGESVTGFDQSDIVPTNGTLSNFAGSGASYTVDIAPASEGSVGVSIPQGAGVGSTTMDDTEADSFTIEHAFVDLQIDSTATDPTPLTTIPVTFTFDESVTGFDSSDVLVSNASLANFSGSGSAYSADLTPLAEGLITVTVNVGAAANAMMHSSEAANFTITHDLPPTVAVSLAASGGALQATVVFNENVTGFDATDIVVTNGTLANFSGSGSTYTFDVINITGPVMVDIADMAAIDSVGNPSQPASGDFLPVPIPDLRIGPSSNPTSHLGNDVYGSTVYSFGVVRKKLNVRMSLENDGISRETFVLAFRKTGKAKSSFTLEGRNVTSDILSGKLQVIQEAGQVSLLSSTTKNRGKSSRKTRYLGVVTVGAQSDPAAADSVGARAIFPASPESSRTTPRDPNRVKP